MTSRGPIAPMRSILEQYLRTRHMRTRARQEQVRLSWREIVGELIARVSSVERIAHGVMYVHCATPVWAHTLSLRKNEILAKISEHVGSNVIREVRFNSLPPYGGDTGRASTHEARATRPEQRKVPLTESQERRIAALAASLKDKGIRESFLRAARSAAAMPEPRDADESAGTHREERSR